jgi:concanavalin A-like lectin/glucanase superfamily protein
MSFDKDLRGTGDIRNLFQRIKRRILKSELPEDIDNTVAHGVNKIMTQIDFMHSYDIVNNPVQQMGVGPFDFTFEPDGTEVMLYNMFASKYGSGLKEAKTLDSINYDVIEIGDANNIRSTASQPYHYEGPKYFNGSSTFLHNPSTTALQLNQFSIACWYRTKTHRLPLPEHIGEGFMMIKGGWLASVGGQNLSYGMWMSDADRVRAGFEEGDSTDHIVSAPFDRDWIDGTWRHMCCTYDKITVRLYADGVEIGTHATTADPEVNTVDFTIGRQGLQGPNNTPLFFEGELDQVYVWNNDLTAGEVSALYSAGTVPQKSALVYQNNFGGSGDGKTKKKCYYAVPQGANNWDWVTPPPIPNTIQFDGSNDYLDMGAQTSLWSQSLSKFSVSMWVNASSVSGDYRTFFSARELLGGDASTSAFFTDDVGGGWYIGFDVTSDDYATNFRSLRSTNQININTWYHVLGVFDLSLSNPNRLKLYVDGVLQSNGFDGGTQSVPIDLNSDAPAWLGKFDAADVTPLHGNMRDFRFWYNRALTPTEVIDVYTDDDDAPTPDYWLPMNEGNGNPIDIIQAKTTTLTNGATWAKVPIAPSISGAISLNIGSNSGQFIYYDEFGTDFAFNAQNFSFGIWIYPTDLSSTEDILIAHYSVDGSNEWAIQIDGSDNKVWAFVEDAGVSTKREYSIPVTENNWYYINITWIESTQTLSLKVNDQADQASTKADNTGVPTLDALWFGGTPVDQVADFKGYIMMPIYYKHSTVLTTAERTSLYLYNTKTDTTKPLFFGMGSLG